METFNTDVKQVVCTDLDIPHDGPITWCTRDVLDGKPAPSVDVWIAKPTRERRGENSIVYLPTLKDHDGYLGAYSIETVRKRFGVVPQGDDCICFENATVN